MPPLSSSTETGLSPSCHPSPPPAIPVSHLHLEVSNKFASRYYVQHCLRHLFNPQPGEPQAVLLSTSLEGISRLLAVVEVVKRRKLNMEQDLGRMATGSNGIGESTCPKLSSKLWFEGLLGSKRDTRRDGFTTAAEKIKRRQSPKLNALLQIG